MTCSRFFEVIFFKVFFRADLGKFGQKSFAPQKFAGSYTYVLKRKGLKRAKKSKIAYDRCKRIMD